MNTRNIAIFGGSFDPFHNGHFALLQKVLARFHFSQLFLTPTFCSPFKEGSFFSPNDRLQMCAIVAKELGSKNCEIVACDFEVAQKRVVYSIELVEYVKKLVESTESYQPKNIEYVQEAKCDLSQRDDTFNGIDLKESKFFFILGLDSFAFLHRWHKFEKLCKEVEFIVCDRKRQEKISFATLCARLQIPHLRAHFLEFDSPLSSTQLRAELQKSLEFYQLDSVLKQIPSCLYSFVKEILLRKEFVK